MHQIILDLVIQTIFYCLNNGLACPILRIRLGVANRMPEQITAPYTFYKHLIISLLRFLGFERLHCILRMSCKGLRRSVASKPNGIGVNAIWVACCEPKRPENQRVLAFLTET